MYVSFENQTKQLLPTTSIHVPVSSPVTDELVVRLDDDVFLSEYKHCNL